MKTTVLIIRTAGTNCDVETAFACEKAGASTERVFVDDLATKDMSRYQILIFPGGFTYGDDVTAGKILANEIKFKYRDKMLDFIERGGLIIGICNGFQVLVKCGILPGFDNPFEEQTVSLVTNDSVRFEDRWVHLRVHNRSVFTQNLNPVITMPVAHAEGKFVVKNETVLEKIKDHIVFQYADESGNDAEYPYDPNGSVLHVAGITDKTGRILGMMPHPERHISCLQHPLHTRTKVDEIGDGLYIFKNAVEYFDI